MTRPEDALEAARSEAQRKRAGGDYAGPAGAGALDESIVSARPSIELLSRWAVIEGDPELLYSTRRAGAPLTAVKRLIARLLRQYMVEVEARQTRFNIALLASVQDLERRIASLEHPGGASDDGSTDPPA